MARYTITVRYGGRSYRYHTFEVDAADVSAALAAAADEIPSTVAATGDLVEVRSAPDPEERAYLDD